MKKSAIALDNLRTGRTVLGKPSGHPPISYPTSFRMNCLLMSICGQMLLTVPSVIADTDDCDQVITRLMLSAIKHLSRISAHVLANEDADLQYIKAVKFMTIAPASALFEQGFGWFVRMSRDYAATEADEVGLHRRKLDELAAHHMTNPAPLPTPAVVWRHQGAQLVTLTHPVQLFDEGIRYGNCLARHFTTRLIATSVYPQALQQMTYFDRVNRRGWQVLSLRRGERRICVFAMAIGATVEMRERQVNRPIECGPDYSPRRDKAIVGMAVDWANNAYKSGHLKASERLPVVEDAPSLLRRTLDHVLAFRP